MIVSGLRLRRQEMLEAVDRLDLIDRRDEGGEHVGSLPVELSEDQIALARHGGVIAARELTIKGILDDAILDALLTAR